MLDLGTNDNANNLISAVSAQQAVRIRNNSCSNSRTPSPVPEAEVTSLPDEEINRSSASNEFEGFFQFFFCFTTLIENLDNDTADGTVVLDSPVEVAQDAPVAPPRSIRRDGFRRTAVRHVDGNSLLDELSRQINQELIEIKVVTI